MLVPTVKQFSQHWKEVFKNKVTSLFWKNPFHWGKREYVIHISIFWIEQSDTHTTWKYVCVREREREREGQTKTVACECSREVEENLGNSLLPNFLVTVLKAMAVNHLTWEKENRWRRVTLQSDVHSDIKTTIFFSPYFSIYSFNKST